MIVKGGPTVAILRNEINMKFTLSVKPYSINCYTVHMLFDHNLDPIVIHL